MYKAKELNVALWKKESENIMSHSQGLDADQLKFLKELKEGDRIILFFNKEKKSKNSPDYSLKVYKPKEDTGDETDYVF